MFAELWNDLRYRLRALVRREALDRDLQAEIDAHITRQVEEYERQGLSAAEARRRARIDFGGVEAIRTDTRQARGTARLESFAHDVWSALRTLRARPAHTIGAMTTLAIGIGTLAVAFAATKAMRIDPLPYPESDRLVMIWATTVGAPDRRLAPTVPEYVAWRDRSNLFEAVGTLGIVDSDLGAAPDGAPAETVVVQQCTASLLRALQLTPLLGRVFTDDEAAPGSPRRVALIGHGLWQRRFAGQTDVIGRTLDLDGVETTIVGVMPDGASPQHNRVDVWAPIRLTPARLQGSGRGWPVIARLRPGVRIPEAQTETDVITARLARTPQGPGAFATKVEPLKTAIFGPYSRSFVLVEAIAVAVFIAACASVAGLFLMHTTSRRQALAVRAAVGAGRGRLVRRVVMESALVAAGGGVAAIGVAGVALAILLSANPLPVPPLVTLSIDGHVLLFVAAATVAGGTLLSVLPALYVWRVRPASVMMASGRHTTESPRSRRIRHTLVVGQIAFATVLLVGAGLLATTLQRIAANPVGGDPRGLVTFTMRYPPAQFRTDRGSHDGLPLMEVSPVPGRESEQIRRRIERLPTVTAAAVVSQLPFNGTGQAVQLVVDDASEPRPVAVQLVSPRFFDTLSIPLIAGRDFTVHDTEATPWGVVINQALAAVLGSDPHPIGRTLRLALSPDERPRTVIGIVGNTKPTPLATGPVPTAYLAFRQMPPMSVAPRLAERLLLTFVTRTAGDPMALAPALRGIAKEVAPDRLPDSFRPLESALAWQVATRHHLLMVFGFFAITITTLAVVAIHGALAHHFAEQARDIGIRLAFGARTVDVWMLTLGRLTRLLLPGVTMGVLAALALSPAIAGALWGVPPGYPPVYITAGLVIGAAAVATTALLVRRVIRTSPAAVLGVE
jgi:predicted permease